jgi:hypothetical protein
MNTNDRHDGVTVEWGVRSNDTGETHLVRDEHQANLWVNTGQYKKISRKVTISSWSDE